MGRFLFFLLTSFIFISGCGPSTTARETEKQQENVFLRQKHDALAPAEGLWQGCFRPMPMRQFIDAEGVEVVDAVVAAAPKPNPTPAPTPRPPPPDPTNPAACQRGGEFTRVQMQVFVVDIFQTLPNRNEQVKVPVLMALWIATGSDDPQVVFTSGIYENGGLQLTSNTVSNGTVMSQSILQLNPSDDDYAGRLIAPKKVLEVYLKKVR